MLNNTEIQLTIVFSLVTFAALISCFETAITAASRAKIHRLSAQGSKRAKILQKLLEEREKVISVMLLANNTVNIAASALTTSLLLNLFGEIGIIYATVSLTVLVIVFGEILPKTIAIKSPENAALFFSTAIYILFKIFAPIVAVIQKIVDMPINLFLGKASAKAKEAELEEIRDAVDLKAKEGTIFKYDKDLLDGVLDLSDTEISEIMVHRKDIKSVNIDAPISEIVKRVTDFGYTRVPLWRDHKENIVAILNVRKLLKELYFYKGDLQKFDLSIATSETWFAPSNNSLRAQLFAFRKKKKRFALVVDEYGTLAGMITLEDILEEIVGEIKEQDDESGSKIIKIKSGAYKIAGKTLIRDINKKLEWHLVEQDGAYNLSAFIIGNLGRIPEEKEKFMIDDYDFEVLKKRHHDLVLVKIKKAAPSDSATF